MICPHCPSDNGCGACMRDHPHQDEDTDKPVFSQEDLYAWGDYWKFVRVVLFFFAAGCVALYMKA